MIPDKRVVCLDGDHTNMRMDNLSLFESKLDRFEREQKQYREYIESRSKLEGAALEAFVATNPEPSYPIW
ncbi:hypothetical protein N9A96_00150 [bacterium]|nr:hypothetical protein [bacterium]